MVRQAGWLMCVLWITACSEEPRTQQETQIRVEGEKLILAEPEKTSFLKVQTVRREQGGVVRLPGRVVWNEDRTARVFPQVAGRIQHALVKVGDSVRAGQVLATLSSPDFAVAEAESSKAGADLAVARKAHGRNRELFEAGVLAARDWEQSEADLLRAQAESNRAALRLAGLGGGGGVYRLKAPIDGIVVERNLNPGLEFRPDQAMAPLFVLTDPGSLWVQMDAGERDLAALQPGRQFSLEVRQYPGERFGGQIRHVADFVDPASRTVKVRGDVGNRDRRLKGEMFVEALIEIPAASRLIIPAQAVFLQGNSRYVFVALAQGMFERRPITVAREGAGEVEVDIGVAPGEKVVVEGNLHLARLFSSRQGSQGGSR